MLYCNKSTGSTGYSRHVLSRWILPARSGSAALMVLLSTGLLTATSALAVDNVQSGYVGSEAGDWGGKNGAVIGPADNICAAMGAVGKINLVSNFGFSLPPETTAITGVTAFVKASEGTQQIVGLQLASDATVDPPTFLGTERDFIVPGTGNNCGNTSVSSVDGGLAGWGNPALTRTIVNSPTFGLVFTKREASNVKVDSICMEIDYTTSGGDATQEVCFGEPVAQTINVIKVVEGEAPGTDWGYTGELGAFTLPAVGGFQTFLDLADDTYTITETTKAGWTVTSECSIDDVQVSTGGASIDVAVTGSQIASCTFTNTRTGTFTVNKDFSDDSTASVDMTLTCSSGTVTTNPVAATEATPAQFEVTGFSAGATCTATEAATPGYIRNTSDCQAGDNLADGGSCTMVNTLYVPPEVKTAVFWARKHFTDGNTADEVQVAIHCNDGTYVPSVGSISDGESKGFVVTQYSSVGLNCWVEETDGPDGYITTYAASIDYGTAGSVSDSETSCYYENVDSGSFSCDISNTPAPVEVAVNKVWDVTNTGGDYTSLTADITIVCESDLGMMPYDDEDEGVWTYKESVVGNDTVTVSVYPDYGGSDCYATEDNVVSAVEVDATDCASMEVSAGHGDSCTITNTLFFEGIPTLNQFGLAILALLMLGVGMVGFRRFA